MSEVKTQGTAAPAGPHEVAALHERRARELYVRDDYRGTVEELKKCVETGVLPEHKDLRMRLFALQSYRRFNKPDLAAAELKRMEERYGKSSEPFIQNLLLNEREFSEGKTLLESKPTRLTIRPTGRCSIHCIMCTFWHEEPWDMPEETLDQIADLYPYMEDILWQGGEVFEIKREVFERMLLRGIDSPRMLQNIITNALLIDERWAEVLVRANVHMRCSIDGATAPVYEKIRVLGKFDNILRSVNNLNNEMEKQRKHCWLSLHFVVQRHNYHQIVDIVEFAKKYKFDAVALSPMEGDSYRSIDVFNYGTPEIVADIERQRALAKAKCLEYGIYMEDNLPPPPRPDEKPHARDEKEEEKRFSLYPMPFDDGAKYTDPERFTAFCASPWKNMILRNRGGVLPNWHCGERYIGNVHDNTVLEIWNGEPMQKVRKAVATRQFGGTCRNYCLSGALSDPWKHHMEWYWS
jgi:MoaA/NifB/PqqE/SkfB family radical SAM enzyme